jgi:hypothetical protein
LRQLDELEGVRRLRSGVLLLILVPLLLFIVAVVGAVAASVALRPGYRVTMMAPGHVFTQAGCYGSCSVSLLAAVGIAILIATLALGSLVLIVMAFRRLRGGFSLLSAAGRGGSIGVTGAWLIMIAIIIALLGAALFMFGGFIAMLIAFVLAAVGFILIGVGLYEVGSSYRNGLLEAGGILVAIPLLITSFIGLILSYVALGDIMRELQAKASQAGAQPATTTL